MNRLKKQFTCMIISFLLMAHAFAGINLIRLDSVQVFPGETAHFGIEVLNEDTFVSFQLDIALPDDFTYVSGSATLNPTRKADHVISAVVTGNNTLRLICFSISNQPFTGHEGDVAYFMLNTPLEPVDHSMPISNYLISNANAQNIATGKIDGAVRTMGPLGVDIICDADTLCFGETATLTTLVSGGGWYPNYSWSSEPTGLNGNQASVTFVPNESLNCLVLVNDGFQTTTDSLYLEVVEPPIANAGDNINSCFGDGIQLNGEAQNATQILWQGGSGSFDDDQSLQTMYYPAEADLLSDSIALVLTAYGSGYCEPESDTLWLYLTPQPVVFAGQSIVLPFDGSYNNTDAFASHYEGLLWSGSGDGLFENPEELNLIYHPGILDMENGEITLTLTAFGQETCGEMADSVTLIVLSADDNVMFLPALSANVSDTLMLQLEVHNRNMFSGFDVNISLPNNMQWLSETASLTDRAVDHELIVELVDNTLDINAVSPSNQSFNGDTGSVFEVAILTGDFAGDFLVQIEDAIISDSAGTNILTTYYDGTISITLVNSHDISLPDFFMKASISPMPLTSFSSLSLDMSEAADVQMTIVGLDGRIRFNRSLGFYEKGRHSISFFDFYPDIYSIPGLILIHFNTSNGKAIISSLKYM